MQPHFDDDAVDRIRRGHCRPKVRPMTRAEFLDAHADLGPGQVLLPPDITLPPDRSDTDRPTSG